MKAFRLLEVLKDRFTYVAEYGQFLYRKPPKRNYYLMNEVAGSYDKSTGYHRIRIDGKLYKVHHLVWLYETGDLPKEIDHINGKRADNRFENLREVTRRKNCQNREAHRKGRLHGASKIKNRWRSYTTVNGKQVHLGCYATEKEANAVAVSYEKEHQL
jgi:hypothetical protein